MKSTYLGSQITEGLPKHFTNTYVPQWMILPLWVGPPHWTNKQVDPNKITIVVNIKLLCCKNMATSG